MAVLRFHRDKRGYEYFSLIEPAGRRGKSGRLLYWFRTPPNVKLGRPPFDEVVQRALEARYPGVQFDWPRILATPIPSAEDDMWRERRRAAKAARLAVTDEPDDDAVPEPASDEPASDEPAAEEAAADEPAAEEAAADEPAPTNLATATPQAESSKEEAVPGAGESIQRRRRRRRRRRGGGQGEPTGGL